MNIKEIIDELDCSVSYLNEQASATEIKSIISSDLMSDVLTDTRDNVILLTSLCTEQAIRTADIIDAKAVIIVKGKKVLPQMVSLAKELNISVLSTKLCKFEASVKIGNLIQKSEKK